MSFISAIIGTAERVPLPDAVIRAAISELRVRTAARLAGPQGMGDAEFARVLTTRPIAEHTEAANSQHYEVPAAFFYNEPGSTLREAEEEALHRTVVNADLQDGQRVLELGCGSLSLWMRRWRWFFLATAGLFGHDEGRAWGVSHYRLRLAD